MRGIQGLRHGRGVEDAADEEYSPSEPRGEMPSRDRPEIVHWLESGRLTLVDRSKAIVGAEQWPELPADVRAQAEADFQRIIRSNTKAAVIFLRP